MTRLAHPWLLVGGTALTVAVAALAVTRRRRQRVPAMATGAYPAGVLLDGLALASVLAGLLAGWLALAGPRRALLAGTERAGLDLVLLLDASGSMGQETGQGSRLGLARAAIERLVRARPDDRIALLAFAGRTAVVCPLTLDHEALLALLDVTSPGDLGRGTALGDALAVALGRFRGAAPAALVVVSDGLSNAGSIDPLTAAEAAARRGIAIDAVGVGSGSGTEPANERLLKAIAERTGGHYRRAEQAAAVTDALADLSRRRPSPRVERQTTWEDRAHVPARWAAALLVLGVAVELTSRRAWA